MAKPYQSDVTRFLAELKRQKPHLESEQRRGRALLWDKPQDPELREDFEAARVAQKPYVYQPDL
jgi:hypothetical protein